MIHDRCGIEPAVTSVMLSAGDERSLGECLSVHVIHIITYEADLPPTGTSTTRLDQKSQSLLYSAPGVSIATFWKLVASSSNSDTWVRPMALSVMALAVEPHCSLSWMQKKIKKPDPYASQLSALAGLDAASDGRSHGKLRSRRRC